MKHLPEKYGFVDGTETFPKMVIVSFSYVCNSKCPNCPYNNSNIRKKYKNNKFISEDIFSKIVEECVIHGALIRITGGGEPSLHPNIVELLGGAKTKGARVSLITNGSAMYPDKLYDLIVNYNIDAIEFSVDASDPDTYSRVRKNLSWKTLNENVNMAKKLRDKYNKNTKLIVSAIDQKGVDIEEIKRYWGKIVDNVQIRKYITWGYNKKGLGNNKSPFLKERVPCPWPFERVSIDTKGNVTLCGHDIAFDHLAGNITKDTIENIWKNKTFEEFRKKHLSGNMHEIPLCAECSDWMYRSWNYNYFKVLKDAKK